MKLEEMEDGQTVTDIYGIIWTRCVQELWKGWVGSNGELMFDTEEDLEAFKKALHQFQLERGEGE